MTGKVAASKQFPTATNKRVHVHVDRSSDRARTPAVATREPLRLGYLVRGELADGGCSPYGPCEDHQEPGATYIIESDVYGERPYLVSALGRRALRLSSNR